MGRRHLGAGARISDAAEALAKGNLKFVLHGQRLRGGWDLVRMKPRPKERQPQWLLIKRRDDEARPGEGERLVEEATTSVSSGRTMEQIAGGKAAAAKPRAAAKRTTAPPAGRPRPKPAAAKPSGFVPPMLCTLVERAPEGRAGSTRSSSTATACRPSSPAARPAC